MKEAIIQEQVRIQGPVQVGTILELSFSAEANQHGTGLICGYLPVEQAESESLQSLENQFFSVHVRRKQDSDEQCPAFCGFVTQLDLVRMGDRYRAEIKLTGATAELDRVKRSRSFQTIRMSYRQIVEEVLKSTPNASAMFSPMAEMPIGKPLIQYQETDWEFLQRLASMMGIQLVPDCTVPWPQFYFGLSVQTPELLPESTYSTLLDRRFYELGGTEAGLNRPDFFSYRVSSWQYHRLGSSVLFAGQALMVYAQRGELKQGELVYTYQIGQPALFYQREIRNQKLAGLSLKATVTGTDGQTVRLALDIDKGKNCGSYPFPWSPETGNIMYCMPKLGTRATLYVPDHDPQNALALSSPRENGSSCEAMSDSQMRCLTTEHGKQMGLYPELVLLSGGYAGEVLQVQLDELSGIVFVSDKSIKLVAKLEISIDAPEVKLNSLQEVKASRSPGEAQSKQGLIIAKGSGCGNPPTGGGATSFLMQYQFDLLSEQSVLCGEIYFDYSPYDDEPDEFDQIGWLTNIAIGVGVALVFAFAAATVAASAVITGGASLLLVGALTGAAAGAGVVTATIAIEDKKSGDVRSAGEAACQIGIGAIVGAVVGYTGAFIAPSGIAAVNTYMLYGAVSGATTRASQTLAMDLTYWEQLKFICNPTAIALDTLTAGTLGRISNYYAVGTSMPSAELVDLHSAEQIFLNANPSGKIETLVDDAANHVDEAFKYGNTGESKQSLTREDILKQLDGVTEQSTAVAEAIRSREIGINILGDELFDKWTGYSDAVAVQVYDQIYIRQSSASLLSDIVHEGTHAIDTLRGVGTSVIPLQEFEMHAYMSEREFQIALGEAPDFPSLKKILDHIKDNY